MASELATALAMSVLPHPGGAVQQHALGRTQLVLVEQLLVQVGQFDRVADQLDLPGEAADVGVGDVGHLLQDQLLDLGLGDALVDVARPGLQQQGVARAQRFVAQRLGDADDPLLVVVGDDQDTVAVLEDLLEHDDLADGLVGGRLDDVERLVQHHLLARPEVVDVDRRAHVHPHLATVGEDLDGLVVTCAQEDPESGRRLGESVDLLLEGHDLVAGLLQSRGQPLVLGGRRRQSGLHLLDPVFEQSHVPRGVGELTPQDAELLFQVGDLSHEFVTVALCMTLVIAIGHVRHLPLRGKIYSRAYLPRPRS
ncbi:hypothetical protein ABH917_000741 [Thermobifida halotolerans]